MALTWTLAVVPLVLVFFQVKEEMLFEALTTRKTVTVGEKLIVPYKLSEVTPAAKKRQPEPRYL